MLSDLVQMDTASLAIFDLHEQILASKLLDRRLLLGHAVDSAQPPNKVSAIYADDLTVWEQAVENVQSNPIVGVIESWDQNQIVGNVEVGITCGETPSFENNRPRHGQLNDV